MLLTTFITANKQGQQTPTTPALVVDDDEILSTDFFNDEYDEEDLFDTEEEDEFNLDGEDDDLGDIFRI